MLAAQLESVITQPRPLPCQSCTPGVQCSKPSCWQSTTVAYSIGLLWRKVCERSLLEGQLWAHRLSASQSEAGLQSGPCSAGRDTRPDVILATSATRQDNRPLGSSGKSWGLDACRGGLVLHKTRLVQHIAAGSMTPRSTSTASHSTLWRQSVMTHGTAWYGTELHCTQ